MPRFELSSVEADGRRRKERVEAADQTAATRTADLRGALVLSVRLLAPSASGRRRLRLRALGDFTALGATLLSSGLTLRDTLSVVAEAADSREVRALGAALGARVDAGRSLRDAFDDVGVDAPPVYRGLVGIGERIGALDAVFPRLARHLEASRIAREKLGGALMYPAIVLSLAIFGLAGLSFYILPKLSAVFGELGGASGDLASRVAVASLVSMILVGLVLLGAIALPLALARRARDAAFGLAFDGLMLRIPLLGPALLERACLSFAFAMEALVSGGLPVDEALLESARAVGNRAVAADILAIREGVLKGKPLSAASALARRLPPYLRQWFSVGERTGQVEAVFTQLRQHYQDRVDRTLDKAMALVEPAIILLVGFALLGLVIFFILPLFAAYGSLL